MAEEGKTGGFLNDFPRHGRSYKTSTSDSKLTSDRLDNFPHSFPHSLSDSKLLDGQSERLRRSYEVGVSGTAPRTAAERGARKYIDTRTVCSILSTQQSMLRRSRTPLVLSQTSSLVAPDSAKILAKQLTKSQRYTHGNKTTTATIRDPVTASVRLTFPVTESHSADKCVTSRWKATSSRDTGIVCENEKDNYSCHDRAEKSCTHSSSAALRLTHPICPPMGKDLKTMRSTEDSDRCPDVVRVIDTDNQSEESQKESGYHSGGDAGSVCCKDGVYINSRSKKTDEKAHRTMVVRRRSAIPDNCRVITPGEKIEGHLSRAESAMDKYKECEVCLDAATARNPEHDVNDVSKDKSHPFDLFNMASFHIDTAIAEFEQALSVSNDSRNDIIRLRTKYNAAILRRRRLLKRHGTSSDHTPPCLSGTDIRRDGSNNNERIIEASRTLLPVNNDTTLRCRPISSAWSQSDFTSSTSDVGSNNAIKFCDIRSSGYMSNDSRSMLFTSSNSKLNDKKPMYKSAISLGSLQSLDRRSSSDTSCSDAEQSTLTRKNNKEYVIQSREDGIKECVLSRSTQYRADNVKILVDLESQTDFTRILQDLQRKEQFRRDDYKNVELICLNEQTHHYNETASLLDLSPRFCRPMDTVDVFDKVQYNRPSDDLEDGSETFSQISLV